MSDDKIQAIKGISALSSSAFEQKVKAEVGLKIAEWKDKGVPLERITFAASKMIENYGFNKEQAEKMITELLSGYHFDGAIGSLKQVKSSGDSSSSGFGQDSSSSSSDKTEFIKLSTEKDIEVPVSISFTVNKMKKLGITGKDVMDTLKNIDKKAKEGDKDSKIALQNWKSAVANTNKEDIEN
ncbi:MAG: hypothetical protein KatS3mg068_1690 [Candidatus Sericytochromatia bacterium]|nr:MAG: hypothetical protein KatS3mg068_1690 [Candidatus Sericytochromatia bacterium]